MGLWVGGAHAQVTIERNLPNTVGNELSREIVQQLQGGAGASSPLSGQVQDPRIIAATIIRASLTLIGILLGVMIVYAGYLYLTAGGNDDQVATAKTMLRNAVIGLFIIFISNIATQYIVRTLVCTASAPSTTYFGQCEQGFQPFSF